MNDIVVKFLFSMLNQKKCEFYFPISSELIIIGETQVTFHDKEGDEGTKTHNVSLKD